MFSGQARDIVGLLCMCPGTLKWEMVRDINLSFLFFVDFVLHSAQRSGQET